MLVFPNDFIEVESAVVRRWIGRFRNIIDAKSIVIASIISFYLYLRIRSLATRNWESSRVVGFSGVSSCSDTGNQRIYGVEIIDLQSLDQTSSVKIPLCYRYIPSGDTEFCFRNDKLSSCGGIFASSLYNGLDGPTLKAIIASDGFREYFRYSTLLIVFGMFVFVFEFVIKQLERLGVVISESQQNFAKKLSFSIYFILIGLMIASAKAFSLFTHESCASVYRGPGANLQAFCGGLDSCGATVSSILLTEDLAVRYYIVIVYCFVTAFGIAILVQEICPSNLRRHLFSENVSEGEIDNFIQRFNQRALEDPSATVLLIRDGRNVHWIRLESHQAIVQFDVNALAARRQMMMAKWKIFATRESLLEGVAEKVLAGVVCTICLDPLLSSSPCGSPREQSKIASTDNKDGNNSNNNKASSSSCGVAPAAESGGGVPMSIVLDSNSNIRMSSMRRSNSNSRGDGFPANAEFPPRLGQVSGILGSSSSSFAGSFNGSFIGSFNRSFSGGGSFVGEDVLGRRSRAALLPLPALPEMGPLAEGDEAPSPRASARANLNDVAENVRRALTESEDVPSQRNPTIFNPSVGLNRATRDIETGLSGLDASTIPSAAAAVNQQSQVPVLPRRGGVGSTTTSSLTTTTSRWAVAPAHDIGSSSENVPVANPHTLDTVIAAGTVTSTNQGINSSERVTVAPQQQQPPLPRGDLESGMITSENAVSHRATKKSDFEPIVQLACKHNFHQNCIMEWALTHVTCPICRLDLMAAVDTTQTQETSDPSGARDGPSNYPLGARGGAFNQSNNQGELRPPVAELSTTDNTDIQLMASRSGSYSLFRMMTGLSFRPRSFPVRPLNNHNSTRSTGTLVPAAVPDRAVIQAQLSVLDDPDDGVQRHLL